MKNVMNSTQCLAMASSSQVEAVSSSSDALRDLEWSNISVLELARSLQFQILSRKQHLVTNCVRNVSSVSISISLLLRLRAQKCLLDILAQSNPVSHSGLGCLNLAHAIQQINRQPQLLTKRN